MFSYLLQSIINTHTHTQTNSQPYDEFYSGPFTVYTEVGLKLYTHIFVELMMLVPQTDKVIQANHKLSTKHKLYTTEHFA